MCAGVCVCLCHVCISVVVFWKTFSAVGNILHVVPSCCYLFQSVALDDDTVLDKINFKDEESNTVTQLSPMEQALLLAVM